MIGKTDQKLKESGVEGRIKRLEWQNLDIMRQQSKKHTVERHVATKENESEENANKREHEVEGEESCLTLKKKNYIYIERGL